MKVIIEYDNVVGCARCPFSRTYSEQGWSELLCDHPAHHNSYFVADCVGFPKGCPISNKEVERVVKERGKT